MTGFPQILRIATSFRPVACCVPPRGAYDLLGAFFMDVDHFPLDNCFMVPVWGHAQGAKDPSHLGTAVLIEYRGSFLLVTAAHVMAHAVEKGFTIPSDAGVFIEVTGERFQIRKVFDSQGNFICDADIAGYFLEKKCAKLLVPRFGFFSHGGLELTGRNLDEFESIIAGFPSHGKGIGPTVLTNRYLSMGTSHVSARARNKKNCVSEVQVMVNFRRRRSWDVKEGRWIDTCHPDGMSGGAIISWIPEAEDPSVLEGQLSAITTDYDEHNNVCFGTRISLIMAKLSEAHPDGFPE